jgi:hypothetical protein
MDCQNCNPKGITKGITSYINKRIYVLVALVCSRKITYYLSRTVNRAPLTVMQLNFTWTLLRFTIFVSLFLRSHAHVSKRRDFNAQIIFLFENSGCTPSQQAIIEQANKDALELANAAFDERADELQPTNWRQKYIKFNTEAAVDYFGPPKLNLGYR